MAERVLENAEAAAPVREVCSLEDGVWGFAADESVDLVRSPSLERKEETVALPLLAAALAAGAWGAASAAGEAGAGETGACEGVG